MVDRVEPEWLGPSSDVTLWVDLSAPGDEERRLLLEVFRFHPLSVEDAVSALQFPKIESYPGYLYLVLHGIDAKPQRSQFATRDVDFFLGRNYLVTVHDGQSRSIEQMREVCGRYEHILKEGPVSLLHRIVDAMVDNYRPVIQEIEDRIAKLEEQAFAGQERLARQVMKLKREVSSMRRVMVPQRDAIGRLARREFSMISDEMAYRFRDVYDHVVRLHRGGDSVSGPGHRHLRGEPVHGLSSPESGDEAADGDVHDLPAADRADRHVGHERSRCRAFPVGPRCSSGGLAASWSRSSWPCSRSSAATNGSEADWIEIDEGRKGRLTPIVPPNRHQSFNQSVNRPSSIVNVKNPPSSTGSR